MNTTNNQDLTESNLTVHDSYDSHESNDQFWIYDPMILFKNGNFYKIIPTKNMTQVQVLNALTRLFLYITIILLIIPIISDYAYISIICILVIIIIYFVSNDQTNNEQFDNKLLNNEQIDKTQENSISNSFVNTKINNLYESQDRLPSKKINLSNENIRNRQFYITPIITPDKQKDFAKWLYDLPETCKENSEKCFRYEDVRFKRHNPDIDS
ncbi:hypothetical protein QLL95_gp1053 [Cotonvirus japonicus]|uniref:Minor capsid protein P9 transmembrane helices domain-containing protein n=1 Tax=Cotonvirus japonicus TaxID=2811091 RepID=A0ABM7NSD3_9VIRU|nr:hypothetical protein QLL95_gp1053 [Cotonvirus japonicus]BCS83070.1 hypothetical protein [Cotonvirus japonicus]